MQGVCETKLNKHIHTSFVLHRRGVDGRGRQWMGITPGLQGSHVTELPKHSWQQRTLVTAQKVKAGQRAAERQRERHGDRGRQTEGQRGLESCRMETYEAVSSVYRSQQQNQCKPYGHQGEGVCVSVCVLSQISGSYWRKGKTEVMF